MQRKVEDYDYRLRLQRIREGKGVKDGDIRRKESLG
jgi:hypothetical protein